MKIQFRRFVYCIQSEGSSVWVDDDDDVCGGKGEGGRGVFMARSEQASV